jgi:nickel-type superoxide dismutase maturation protease
MRIVNTAWNVAMGMCDVGRSYAVKRSKDAIDQRSHSGRCRHEFEYSCVQPKWTSQAHPVYTQGVPRLPPWLIARLPLANFVVADTSMQPALQPGDRILVNRWSRVQPGDIVVLRDPEFASTILIKRIADATSSGQLQVRGDNPNVSRDSRVFGAVARRQVMGKVVFRYMPAERRGRVA